MKSRILVLLALGIAAIFAGCSRPDDVTGPTTQEPFVSSVDYNVVALASFDGGDLTPEQKQKLEEAMKRYHEAVRAIMEKVKSGSITREEARSQLQELERQLDEEVKSILTPEQYVRWQEHRRYVRDNKGIPYPLPIRLERLAALLNLTADQVEKAKGIVEQAQKDIRAAVESIKEPVELRKVIEEILKRADTQFQAILTAEQAAKYEELKKGLHPTPIPYPLFAPLERLAIALNLSADQVQKAQAIVERAQNELRTALGTITDPAELRRAVQEILAKADEQFRSILTTEQLAKYEQLKGGRQQPRPPYPLPFPLERLALALSLTPDQVEQARSIVEQAQKDIQSAIGSITDRAELRRALEEILKRADEQFRAILTADQLTKYEQLKHGMHQMRYPYPLPFLLDVLTQKLQLTSEQIEKAKAIIETAAQEIKTAVDTIRDPAQLRQALQQILLRADQAFRAILTEEQAAKYDEMKHRRGTRG